MRRTWGLLGVALAVALVTPGGEVNQAATWQWVTDTPVSAAVAVDNVAYLGGGFSYIGAETETGESFVDASSGSLSSGCATRTGSAAGLRPVVVPDPSGGLFMQVPLAPERLLDADGVLAAAVSQSFVRVGADCRFDRTFQLDAFIPGDVVTRGVTITRVGDAIYVGGSRPNGPSDRFGRVVAFNGTTGTRLAEWDFPQFDVILIEGVAPDGRLVVSAPARGGQSSTAPVGLLTPSSGAFQELTTVGSTGGFVKVAGATLYAVAGPDSPLQAIDLATAQPKPGWGNPALTVNDLEVAGERVFVAGQGMGRLGVFALAQATGALVEAFAPPLGASPGATLGVQRLAVVGSRLFLRGRTVRALDGDERYLLAAVDTATGAADAWAPMVFAQTIQSIDLVPNGDALYIGRVLGAELLRRSHLAAVDIISGEVLAFNPGSGGSVPPIPPVTALAVNSQYLFAGTSESQIRRVALTTGLADAWGVLASATGFAHGHVAALAVTSTTLYAGGFFDGVATSAQPQPVPRGHGLAVDIATAQVAAWNPAIVSPSTDPRVEPRPVQAIAVAGGAIAIGGNLTAVSGQARAGLAIVDAATAEAMLPAITLPSGGVVLDIAADGANAYYVGANADSDRLIGRADVAGGSMAEWIVPAFPPGQDPASHAAYLDGLVYSGPAWDATTAAPVGSAARWGHPAATDIGVLELDDPLDGADGPMRLRFHALGTPISPRAPRNLVALHAGNDVYLSWTAPVIGGVESYVVRAGSASGYSNLVDYDTGSTATELWATAPDRVYYVRVHARRADGVSPPSNEVAFAISAYACNSPPTAPGPLSGSGTDVQAMLAWGRALGAHSYVVEAGRASGQADIAVLSVGPGLGYQTPAPPGTYFVRVRGRNDCGAGPASNEVIVQVGGPPPEPPTNLQFQVSGRTVTLSWDAPTTGAPPGRYRLEAGSAPGLANLATAGTTERTFATTNVPDGTYYVRVRSVSATGTSAPTPDVVVVIP
ncbi:MAG: hypothetical protein IT177_07395 [Acidobacteria bacterium]|nr:hypothetical protein [Acidobacteriota bacterium]